MQYEKKLYPDGSFYAEVNSFAGPLTITERINSYNDLWFIKQLKDICDHHKYAVDLFVPCLIDAQADRRFANHQSFNLKLVCDFINDLKFEKVKVFHPHNPEVVEALIDNCVIVDNSEFISACLIDIQENFGHGQDDIILFSTDAGGFKPLMKLADKIWWKGEVYAASKARKFENLQSKLVQMVDRQDFKKKNILIIDDLCVYGGTFLGLHSMLKERNVGDVFLAVSHITVPDPNPRLELFDRIYTTNSKFAPPAYSLKNLMMVPVI